MRYLFCAVNAKYIHSNPAVFSLRAYARAYGPESADYIIKEYTINQDSEEILRDLYLAGADVYVFSCYIWNISQIQELARELGKVLPGVSIWAGGPEVTYHAEDFLEANPAVDLVMQGEGEDQFLALVNLWEEAGCQRPEAGCQKPESFPDRIPPARIPRGCVLRTSHPERPMINQGMAPPVDLSRIPFPYEDLESFEHKIIYYESSRGCPFSCSYCLSSVEKGVRFRPLDLVVPELQAFLDAGVSQVKFVDRTFNSNKDHSRTIWRYIRDHDQGTTNFHFEISADLLEEEDLAIFAGMRPGLIQLEIGVQSTHSPTLQAICRHTDLVRLFAMVDRVHALGNIHQHLDLIAGLPFEDADHFRKSFNDLYIHSPDQLQLGFLKILKGTRMERKQEEYGMVSRSLPPYEVRLSRWISFDEIIRLKDLEEMVETYYNSRQFVNSLNYMIPFFPSPFDCFTALADWYREKGYQGFKHSRLRKYEILREFAFDSIKDTRGFSACLFDELVLVDLYLREKLKKRPAWAADQKEHLKDWKKMYIEQGEVLFPDQWKAGNYDSKKAAADSHLECLSFDPCLWMEEGRLERGSCLCLFDYAKRNPLDHNAQLRKIPTNIKK